MNALSLFPAAPVPEAHRKVGGPAGERALPEDYLSEAHDAALEGLLLRSLDADPEGREHPQRVGRIGALLAETLGIAPAERIALERAAALHDIGKMALPDGILGSAHVLDPQARRIMESHTVLGAAILTHARQPWICLARVIALCHHERWDGSGYPHGLAGEAVPLAARLVAVADVYDALRSERPYKGAQDHGEALQRIMQGDGRIHPRQFDPAVLAALEAREAAVAALPR